MHNATLTHGPELVYSGQSYADVTMYAHVPGGDWKLTVSRDMETDEIYENVEYGKDDDCFEEADEVMPAVVRALFDEKKPAAVRILMAQKRGQKMKKPETNIEIVTRMMTFSPTGALSQMFIIAAIDNYSKAVAAAPPIEHGLINGEAWKRTAEWIQEELENRG